jgi:hypothetical protein
LFCRQNGWKLTEESFEGVDLVREMPTLMGKGLRGEKNPGEAPAAGGRKDRCVVVYLGEFTRHFYRHRRAPEFVNNARDLARG